METIKIVKHKFQYKWNLLDSYPAKNIQLNNLNVFGTFICGGSSSMGYKLAGFNHLGGVEIDPKVADVYKTNHNPKYLFVEDIREFVKRIDLPKELYNLDILDGSPPCSSFSMAGNREKDWGKEKIFKEGQALQVLDDLFFDYIALAKKLQPKVVIAENVKGLIQGNAKSYVHKIKVSFEDAGYKVQLFLLNAASMGVPQKRERVFFICQRNDLNLPKLELKFNEKSIQLGDFIDASNGLDLKKDGKLYLDWLKRKTNDKNFSDICLRNENKQKSFGRVLLSKTDYAPTIVSGNLYIYFDHFKEISKIDICKIGTFPLDYNFKSIEPKYLIGMSVPPIMTAQIAHEIYLQWFSKL